MQHFVSRRGIHIDKYLLWNEQVNKIAVWYTS